MESRVFYFYCPHCFSLMLALIIYFEWIERSTPNFWYTYNSEIDFILGILVKNKMGSNLCPIKNKFTIRKISFNILSSFKIEKTNVNFFSAKTGVERKVFFLILITMWDNKHKQQINVKFVVKLEKLRLNARSCLKRLLVRILYIGRVFSIGINGVLKTERASKMTNVHVDIQDKFYKLNIMRVCAKLVPKNLTPDQTLDGNQIFWDFLDRLDKEPGWIENIISCDKTWILGYDVETKRQSLHRKTSAVQWMKKAMRISKSKFKAVLINFFDINYPLKTSYWALTVNQIYYLSTLRS